jgi:hypothetical protein
MPECVINRIFEPHHAEQKRLFDEAVKARDALVEERNRLRAALEQGDASKADEARWKARLQKIAEALPEAQDRIDRHLKGMYEKGYFSDPKDALSVLSALGLSWERDVAPALDRRSGLKGRRLKAFAEAVAERPLPHVSVEWLKERGMTDEEIKLAGGVRKIQHRLEERRNRLAALLAEAVETGLPLRCSL